MSQEIKPILHVNLTDECSSQQELQSIKNGLVELTEGQYYVVVTAFTDAEQNSIEILSPYKENGEVPQEVLDWMKTQVDGTEAGL